MNILLVFLIIIIVMLFIDHRWVKTTYYEIESEKLPSSFDGYKILQLSDLHNENLTHQLLAKIDKENPDIVVMTGDMVSANHRDFTAFFKLAKQVSDKYKVYYIKGNHEGELRKKDYELFSDTLYTYGIENMDNEMLRLEKDGEHINLYGMWCNQRYYSRADSDEEYKITKDVMEKLLGTPNKNEYNVLLFHTPSFFEEYEKWGADLVLSGHMHGGLIKLPKYGGVFSPDRKMFPKYCYGRFDKNDTTMIISSGLSRGSTGFRLFNRPEIVVTTLNKK